MNPDTHFYLYAKGHYKKSDIIEDVTIILSQRSAVPVEYIQPRDIAGVLLELTWKHIKESGNPEYQFIDFISKLNPVDIFGDECWSGEFGFYKTLLANCLSVLRHTKVAGLDLGYADPNILPVNSRSN